MTSPGAPPPVPLPGAAPAPLPGWLGPLVTITTQVGVPTVVAGVLLWFVLTRVDGTMRMIQHEEEARTQIMAAMQDSLVATLERNAERFEQAIHENIEANKALAAAAQAERRRQP